jgi:transcriptional regulator with XRE-family HTH domain
MDQKAFAEQLGKKVSWTYRLEDPNAPAPTIATLLEVAKAFDVDLCVEFRPFSQRLDALSRISEMSFWVRSFDEELADTEREGASARLFAGELMHAPSSTNSRLTKVVYVNAGLQIGNSPLTPNRVPPWLVPKNEMPPQGHMPIKREEFIDGHLKSAGA